MSNNQLPRVVGSIEGYNRDLGEIVKIGDPSEAYERCIVGFRRVERDRNFSGHFEDARKALMGRYCALITRISEEQGSTEARATEL